MTLSLHELETFDSANHSFRVLVPGDNSNWLESVATEYVRLRTQTSAPLQNISVEGIQVLCVDDLRERLRQAGIPKRRPGNFDVVRSDFGEVLCYMLLEKDYGTKFGYKSVRDREVVQLPGKGIDAVGIEDGEPLTLVLGEVKVSDENASPPHVVDRSGDCLRKQHLNHLGDLVSTAGKIWHLARHILDTSVRDLLFVASLYLENGCWDKLQLVACCVLVRPRSKYNETDFGSFRQRPDDYSPARVRFLAVCIPNDVETVVQEWYEIVGRTEAVA